MISALLEIFENMAQRMMDNKSDYKFFPYYFFEISIVSMFTVELVLLLAVVFPPAVGREVDFSAHYSPRPEWYFLSLYQLTKYFPGKWTFVGAVLLPGLTFCVLLLAPFLDSGSTTSLWQRKIAMTIGFCLLSVVMLLTVLAIV